MAQRAVHGYVLVARKLFQFMLIVIFSFNDIILKFSIKNFTFGSIFQLWSGYVYGRIFLSIQKFWSATDWLNFVSTRHSQRSIDVISVIRSRAVPGVDGKSMAVDCN